AQAFEAARVAAKSSAAPVTHALHELVVGAGWHWLHAGVDLCAHPICSPSIGCTTRHRDGGCSRSTCVGAEGVMMRRAFAGVALVATLSSDVHAQQHLVGDWHGSLATPAGDLTLVFRFAQNATDTLVK